MYISTSPKNAEAYDSMTASDMDKRINRAGMSWEAGRMPVREDIEGSTAIADLADFVFALARDTTNEDNRIQRTTVVKTLKSRFDGTKNGRQFNLYYGDDGILREVQ